MRQIRHRPKTGICERPVRLGSQPLPRGADKQNELVPTAVLVCPVHGLVPADELYPRGSMCIVFVEGN